jgi:hypothetical protein
MTKLKCDICGEKHDLICECQTCNNKEHKKSWKMGYDVCSERVLEIIEGWAYYCCSPQELKELKQKLRGGS